MIKLALLKNKIDGEHGKFEISDPEKLKNYAKEIEDFDKYMNYVWDSNREFEVLVCTKSIDLIGESKYFDNQISTVNLVIDHLKVL